MRTSRIVWNRWAAQVLTRCGLCINFTEIEVVKCGYGVVNEHMAKRKDISTELLFIVSLKTTKKERKRDLENSFSTRRRSQIAGITDLSTSHCANSASRKRGKRKQNLRHLIKPLITQRSRVLATTIFPLIPNYCHAVNVFGVRGFFRRSDSALI